MACFATPFGLRYAAHCFNRAHAQQNGSALIPGGGKLGVTSVFNLLKRERIRRRTYKTREEARQDVFDYIEMFYSPVRKHVRNGMLSPVEFERQQAMQQQSV